jgi:hypothetical protein
VVPLPVLPPGDVTLQRRAEAFAATFAGRMEDAVDIYRLSVEADGWMDGLLKTMSHGVCACDLSFKGSTPEVRSWLLDADGTPGDFFRMHPENEVAKILSDMIGIGIGLGQYVLLCWNCDGIEWTIEPAQAEAEIQVDQQRCKRCKLLASQRPPGARVLYQLCWRDPRWLWRNTVSGQWRYTGRQGQVDVNPGDGEWFLCESVPDTDVWRHGPWVYGTIAAIFARDATFDRQATSAVCAPTPVFEAQGGTGQTTRKDVEAQAENLRFQNKIVLPGEWKFRIEAAKAEFVDVTAAIVEWASTMWAVGITGNAAALKPATGFANLDFYAVTERARRRFLAGTFIRQIATQGLRWYVLENAGPGVAVPVGHYDTRSPKDKLDASAADEAEGKALASLRAGLDAVGYELDPVYVEERAQAKGIRIRAQANKGTRILTWDPKTLSAFTTMEQAIADQGLPALPPGDPRATMMVAAALQPGGPATPAGATASPPPVAPATGAPPPSHQPARIEAGEELDEDVDDLDEDEIRAKLAGDYTAAGLDRCPFHGRTHVCQRCGVRREYRIDPVTRAPVMAWRPLKRVGQARARIAADQDAPLLAAVATLERAVAALEGASV